MEMLEFAEGLAPARVGARPGRTLQLSTTGLSARQPMTA
jgi:hypothetical protein